jgi:hypothetical protein
MLALAAVQVLMAALGARFPGHPLYGLPRFFALGTEGNLPTYFAALCLLLAGLLLACIAAAERTRERIYWGGLSVVFLFLSLDEAAQIHDGIVNTVMRGRYGALKSPWFHYGWVVPAMGAVGALGLLYGRFLWRLPRRHALLFVAAGAIYVSSAMGMEMVEGMVRRANQPATGWFPWRLLAEECGEMAGVIVFIHALLGYLDERAVRVTIFCSRGDGPGGAA